MGFRLERFNREHATERGDRFACAADSRQALRQQFLAVEHRRLSRQQRRQQLDHLAIASFGGESLCAPERFIVGNLVFWVWERRAGRGGWWRRRRVAERPQSLLDVGICRGGLCERGSGG